MAFVPSRLAMSVDTIGGDNLRIHFYTTTDQDITETGYFVRGQARGMRLHDIVVVNDGTRTYTVDVIDVDAVGDVSVAESTDAVGRLDKTSAYSVTRNDDKKLIVLSANAGYTLTYGAASGYNAHHSNTVRNEGTTRAKVINVGDGKIYRLYPGQQAEVSNSNGVWKVIKPNRFRPLGVSGISMWISPTTGINDNDLGAGIAGNDGLAITSPVRTPQEAYDRAVRDLDAPSGLSALTCTFFLLPDGYTTGDPNGSTPTEFEHLHIGGQTAGLVNHQALRWFPAPGITDNSLCTLVGTASESALVMGEATGEFNKITFQSDFASKDCVFLSNFGRAFLLGCGIKGNGGRAGVFAERGAQAIIGAPGLTVYAEELGALLWAGPGGLLVVENNLTTYEEDTNYTLTTMYADAGIISAKSYEFDLNGHTVTGPRTKTGPGGVITTGQIGYYRDTFIEGSTPSESIYGTYDGYQDVATSVNHTVANGTNDVLAIGGDDINMAGTGAESVTSLGTSPRKLKRITVTGAFTLVHNATSLILPKGGSNIVTAIGDNFTIRSDQNGNVRVLYYQRFDGTALT